jgi:glucose dehydrogenase
MTANPEVFGDVLYIQDAKSNIYAIDKTTGSQIWEKFYDQVVPAGGPNGIALGYGLAVFPVGTGDVAAITLDEGEEVWQVSIEGPRGEGITMAPLIYDNTVYISTIPGQPEGFYEGGMRGLIYALDINDGSVLWYFDTTTDNLWGNARENSGGGLWHPPSIDDDGNLYVGIGNAGPLPGSKTFPSGSSRPGDNDYANSLLRINPDSASVDWYINVKPHDLFDLDNQLTPILATMNIDGSDTPVVYSSGKHGYVVCANAENGQELWRTALVSIRTTMQQTFQSKEKILSGSCRELSVEWKLRWPSRME